MTTPTSLPAAPDPARPTHVTVMSRRTPRTKYHRTRGHAINAVLYKVQWRSALSEDVAIYAWDEAMQTYVLRGSWKRGDKVTKNDVVSLLTS